MELDAVAALQRDEVFLREFAMLREAEQRYRTRGVDIRAYLPSPVTHPFLVFWQRRSDEIVEEASGRSDLRRRFGALRMLDGEDYRFPFDLPWSAWLPRDDDHGVERRVFRLYDELEYHVIPYRPCNHPEVPVRPVADVLGHREARAILGWPAKTLDYWISAAPEFLGGLRKVRIPDEARAKLDARAARRGKQIRRPRSCLHRVSFDTMEFMLFVMRNQS